MAAVCPICDDTGFKIVTRGGVEGAAPCDCRVPVLSKALLERSGIPQAYAGCTLENFKLSQIKEPGLFVGFARTVIEVRKYESEFNRLEVPGLALFGRPGSGKTHLAVATMREIMRHWGTPAVFLDCAKMLEQVRQTFGTGGAGKSEALTAAKLSTLVVLDDLGAQTASEWVQDTIAAVINERYNARLSTIVTTSLEPDEISTKLGPRTASRLMGMCRYLQLPRGAADFRATHSLVRKRKGV